MVNREPASSDPQILSNLSASPSLQRGIRKSFLERFAQLEKQQNPLNMENVSKQEKPQNLLNTESVQKQEKIP